MLVKKIFLTLAATSLTCLTATHSWALTAATNATTSSTTRTTSTSGVAGDELVSRYTKLAGSKTNAQSLITGLRTGSIVTLAPSTTASTPAVSFTPTTQKMGYGNINIALSLAKTTLAKQGITNPTPEQLAAALNGGNITLANGTVVTMTGILTQRSAGLGWGKIAQTAGVKLGTVVSASKTDMAGKKDALAKTDDDSKKERVVKVEKTEKDDKKDILAKAENAKNHSATSEGGASSAKGSSSSSSSNSGGNSGGNSANSQSGGSGSGSSNGGGSKSSGGGSSNSGGNGGGNSGGGGGGGGGGKK